MNSIEVLQQRAMRALGLAGQAHEDRLRAERALDILKQKEVRLTNEALAAVQALEASRSVCA